MEESWGPNLEIQGRRSPVDWVNSLQPCPSLSDVFLLPAGDDGDDVGVHRLLSAAAAPRLVSPNPVLSNVKAFLRPTLNGGRAAPPTATTRL